MARFRTSYQRHSNKGRNTDFFRIILLLFIAGSLIFFLYRIVAKDTFRLLPQNKIAVEYEVPGSTTDPNTRFFLPAGSTGETVHHAYYSLSYHEQLEIPEWVAYELTKKNLVKKRVERTNWFNEDPEISTGSALYHDYSGSGFNRGHMAPAADMAFSRTAMEESFFMSNMVPKVPAFNNGIWRELEENVRDWAYKNGRLFIVTGPVLSAGISQKIGKKNKVGVPKKLFKVILDLDEPELKSIAFVIDNELSTRHLSEYALSIDSVELLTGFDFFSGLMSEDQQKKVESDFNLKKWPLSEEKFRQRLNSWNNQQ